MKKEFNQIYKRSKGNKKNLIWLIPSYFIARFLIGIIFKI